MTAAMSPDDTLMALAAPPCGARDGEPGAEFVLLPDVLLPLPCDGTAVVLAMAVVVLEAVVRVVGREMEEEERVVGREMEEEEVLLSEEMEDSEVVGGGVPVIVTNATAVDWTWLKYVVVDTPLEESPWAIAPLSSSRALRKVVSGENIVVDNCRGCLSKVGYGKCRWYSEDNNSMGLEKAGRRRSRIYIEFWLPKNRNRVSSELSKFKNSNCRVDEATKTATRMDLLL